jgi:nicotinate phosphoribosyltransferase
MANELALKKAGKIKRLTNQTFQFPQSIRQGFYTANYFLKTQAIIQRFMPRQMVTMQFFQWQPNLVVCGLDEVIALIHTFAHHPEQLTIEALEDGDVVQPKEPVLKITGAYEDFGFLESTIDGILSRRSSVATNTRDVLKAANGKPVFSMADRQDDYLTQSGDGYASYIMGIDKVSTDAQGAWWGGKGMGTMPHALIQMCQGDLVKACQLYGEQFPEEKITALVDYNNDVIGDALKVAAAFKDRLKAVRVDTSQSLVDVYFTKHPLLEGDPHGVNPWLIHALRNALDQAGFHHVQIIVSSGFNPEKIQWFEQAKAPVNLYGVGLYLVTLRTNFTGDLVRLNGRPQAKVGRQEFPSLRLKNVPYPLQP